VEVPWQSYPGHEPCPLPLPEGYSTQWATRRPRSTAEAVSECVDRLRSVCQRGFPNRLFSRPRYVAACFADLVMGPRYTYAFSALWPFLRYGRHCVAPIPLPGAQP
jgi:hypothetical protein